MSRSSDVLQMLIPTGGYITVGDDFEGIEFIDCAPITKKEFEAGAIKYNVWIAEQEAKAAAAIVTATSKLTALGLTAADLKALGL